MEKVGQPATDLAAVFCIDAGPLGGRQDFLPGRGVAGPSGGHADFRRHNVRLGHVRPRLHGCLAGEAPAGGDAHHPQTARRHDRRTRRRCSHHEMGLRQGADPADRNLRSRRCDPRFCDAGPAIECGRRLQHPHHQGLQSRGLAAARRGRQARGGHRDQLALHPPRR